MTEPRLARAFLRLQADLRALSLSWALVGGLGVSARAEPRTTRDIDVAIAVADDGEAEQVVKQLRHRGYLDEQILDHRDVARLSTVRFTRRGNESGIFYDLLFATAGIEPEVVAEADLLEVLPRVFAPVAKTGHLLALKVLALRTDRPHERPQDFADIRELLRIAGEPELERARAALEVISRRGFDRGKDLHAVLEEQLLQFREQG